MSVVANSFTKNTHAQRILGAQAPKASVDPCASSGSALHVRKKVKLVTTL